MRGTLDADFNWLTTTKKNANEAAEAIETARRSAETEARAIAENRTALDAVGVVVRATQEKAAAAVSTTEKARDEAAAVLKLVNDDAAAVTQARANAEAASSAIQAPQPQVSELAAKAQTDASYFNCV